MFQIRMLRCEQTGGEIERDLDLALWYARLACVSRQSMLGAGVPINCDSGSTTASAQIS
jgi:hypothetical protein